MNRRPTRRSNPWVILLLLAAVGVMSYVSMVIVPATPPLFIPTATPTRNPESYVNEAEQFYADGKLAQAVSSYKQAIVANPDDPSLYITLARLQVFAGDYQGAITNAQNALLKNPDNPLAHAVLGWALGFTGDYLPAEASIKKALDLDPNNALAHAYYAEILINRGEFEDFDKAASASRRAKELEPNSLEVHRARGLVLVNSGSENIEEAIQEFKAALAINDKIADLHLNLGFAYRVRGDNDLAVDELLSAYALNPQDATIPTEIMLSYSNEGQYGKAAQYAEDAVKIEPENPRLRGNLGVMYYQQAKATLDNALMDQAIVELGLAVRGGVTEEGATVQSLALEYGKAAEYYWFYGFALARRDRCNEAVPVFQALVSGVPDYELAVANAQAGLELCLVSLETPEPELTATP